MFLCDKNNHGTICFDGNVCPLCESYSQVENQNKEIKYLEHEICNLKEYNQDLQKELREVQNVPR